MVPGSQQISALLAHFRSLVLLDVGAGFGSSIGGGAFGAAAALIACCICADERIDSNMILNPVSAVLISAANFPIAASLSLISS